MQRQLQGYAYIADFLGLGGNTTEEKIDNLIAMLRKMNDELNIPHCIKHYGEGGLPAENGIVPEDEFLEKLHDIAANAILDACTGSNPRQPSQEEMEKLLKCCYYDTEVDFKLSINKVRTAGCVKQPAVFYIIGRECGAYFQL